MQKIQKRTDKFAITVSLACAIHCLFVPSFVILSAGFLSITIDNELIHKLLIPREQGSFQLLIGPPNPEL